MREWIDVSVPVCTGMAHWPGDPETCVTRVSDMELGDTCNVSRIECSAHAGTHVDAPLHFLREGQAVDAAPLDALIGPARVIEIADAGEVRREELQAHRIRTGERILLKTRNSLRCWNSGVFLEDFIGVSLDAAEFLAGRRVRLVGIDYLSVGGFGGDSDSVHRALLKAGIWIVEGLNLASIQPGCYDLLCLPLRLAGSDGAPARAVLRRRRER